jgi:hypothetical protein
MNHIVSSLILVATAPVTPSTSANAVSPEAVQDGSQTLVCKSTQRTGTRFQSKVCRTRAVWEQIEEETKRQAREMIDRPVIETRRD